MKSSTSLEDLSLALQSQWDALQAFASIGLKTLERLSTHNMATLHAYIEEGANAGQGATPLEALTALPARQAALIERTRAYWHNLFEICSEAQEEARAEASSRMGSSNQAVTALLEKLTKSMPAGNYAMDTFRSVMAAAGQTIDSLGRAAQQMAEISESSVEAAADATAKAITHAEGESRDEQPKRRAA